MKKRTIVISVSLAAILIAGGLSAYLYRQIQNLETYRPAILKYAREGLGRDIRYASGHVSLGFGPMLTFEAVTIMEKNGRDHFASAARLDVRVALLPYLWEGKIVLKEINLQNPRLMIVRDRQGKWNIDDLMETKKEPPVELGGLTVRDGSVTFLDQWISPEGVQTGLKEIRLNVDYLQRERKTGFHLEGVLADNSRGTGLKMEGSLQLPGPSEPLIDGRVDARLRIRELDLAVCRPYYGKRVPFRNLAGLLSADLSLQGRKRDFSSSGTIEIKKAAFQYPEVFPDAPPPASLRLVYDLKRTPGEVSLRRAELAVDQVRVTGQGTIGDLEKEDPFLDVRATLGPFDRERYGKYIPYGLMPPQTAAFIRENIRAGIFNMHEGALAGRLSRLRKWGEAGHDNLLLVKTSVTGGVVGFGGAAPGFNGIAGELVFTERDIQLNRMTGFFGSSPVALTGKIAGYSLSGSATYPFTASMQPAVSELGWLLGEETVKKLALKGPSTLKLNGAGPWDDYRLKGEWNLTAAAYGYGELMKKPPGRDNRLNFVAAIRGGNLEMDPFHYSLGSLALSGTLRMPFKEAGHIFSLSFRTNMVDLRELRDCFPELGRRQASGPAQAGISGEGGGKAGTPARWRGDIYLQGVTGRLAEKMKTVEDINGSLHLEGDRITSSRLSGRLGGTPFTVGGTVQGFKEPSFSLTFSLPFFHPPDFGYRSLPAGYKIRDVSGDIAFRGDLWQIRSLTARLNDTVVTAKGSVQDGRARVVRGDASFSYLKGEELATLLKAGKTGDGKAGGPPVTVQATVRATAGRYGELSLSDLRSDLAYNTDTPGSSSFLKATVRASGGKIDGLSFKDLRADLSYVNDELNVSSLNWAMGDGHGSARGATRFPLSGPPGHHYQFRLERVPAEALFRTGGKGNEERRLSGSLTASGDLAGKGKTAAELKASAAGTVNIGAKNGIIGKVNVLYGIFSVLNVSQLLKFKLPDLTADGMPYNSIAATLHFGNGVMTSNDFYIDSDVMNILALGSVDLARNTIDSRVGLQPLQTVDKIVSRIPVAGWILTDDDRRWITVYFEVKGPLADPAVRAMPVRELSAEGRDIFKRVFKLPRKLITDAGEISF